jgi:ATP-dependent Clp protease ATP-binding subunit ClpC
MYRNCAPSCLRYDLDDIVAAAANITCNWFYFTRNRVGTIMDLGSFNWNSTRAQHARYGHALSPWVIALKLSVVLLIAVGIFALVVGVALGWALIGIAAVPIMVVQWYTYELKNMPINSTVASVDGVLDTELLALLPRQPSPKDIALALMKVNGGLFFEVRFGIGGSFLKEVASNDRSETEVIFKEALLIAQQVGGRISPGVVILAMVRQLPARQTLLGHLQLEEDDLMRGILWYHHLDTLIAALKKRPKQSGGIGRDWSFGYIPNLARYGSNISQSGSLARGEIRIDALSQLIGSLANNSGAIALVGKDGSGKTELVYELAEKLMYPTALVPKKLQYQQVIMLDASRLVSAAGERGGLEQIVTVLLNEAYTAKNIIICLDNAELFFEDGVGSVDVSNLLLPILQAGRLPIILTIDEQKFMQISQRNPALATAVNRISVHPTDEAETLKVLEDHLPTLEYKRKVTFMYQALKDAYKLSLRYVYDISMPGQAISLLEAAAGYAESGLVTSRSVAMAIEQTTGVKTSTANNDDERSTLLNLESLIHQRMIGQERAVSVVSDALRRARSGVRNQNRPVGTFMFLGPTGVGKTELAKSLAAVYFGGEQNMIRLDMNEFVSSNDVARLIADGSQDPNSLTAQVMKQPFSVILLDEIEKAHSSVLTTLLQLLDEGILRDVRNREVSFRDTVVIATSNAGSDRIQEYLSRGYSLQQFEETFVSELISSHLFHPEFLNRFDEIVVFGPLTKPELLQVVDLILVSVNKNLQNQKITVTVAQDAKEYLVEAGYDPRLGARPMRRVVENTVAKLLLSNEVTAGGYIEITLDQVRSILERHDQANQIVENTLQ